MAEKILGIDIGGSGIKAAPVDVEQGKRAAKRLRLATPQPASPEAIAGVCRELVEHFSWSGEVGCGFPGVVREGLVSFAPNLDPSWVGENAEDVLAKSTGLRVAVINDADAAGLAEMRWGEGQGHRGVVLVLTFGSGIGSALFHGGVLLRNTELGHLFLRGMEAEHYAAAEVRKQEGLSFEDWGDRVQEYLAHLERLLSPELIILGGGVSRKFDEFSGRLRIRTPVQPARLRNNAGLIGAAYWATMRWQAR